jgi:hypothetical protein
MLVSTKPGADFWRGCASKKMGHLLFATLPHSSTRELTAVVAPLPLIGPGLRRIAVIDFRVCTFHPIW